MDAPKVIDQVIVPFHDGQQADVLRTYNDMGYTAVSMATYRIGYEYILFNK